MEAIRSILHAITMLPYGFGTTVWARTLQSYKKRMSPAVAMFPCTAWA